MAFSFPRLYAITDLNLSGAASHAELVSLLCSGGARLIQMREKGMSDRELLSQARDAVAAAKEGGARLILNDRPDVAQLAGAHGVHLGDQDLPATAARRLLGDDAIIGVSTHSVEEAMAAFDLSVDYIALGPVFATGHSSVKRAPLGLATIKEAAVRVSRPFVAIGGITLDNAGEVLSAGASSVAVIGDIMSAPDISARVSAFLDLDS